MIYLSAGMPRAGSGWHYNLIHDLMQTAGCIDARAIREKYRLQKVLTEVNCNIGVLSARRLGMTAIPALMGNSFVIKAHAGPTPTSRLFQRLGLLRITYIYRDPRDAMLSAFDYGQRALQKGRPNAFSHLTDFNKSLAFILEYIRIWERWSREKGVLIARYEELLMNYDEEVRRLLGFLKLDGSKPEGSAEPGAVLSGEAVSKERSVQKVTDAFRPEKGEGQQGLHFFKGKIGRFRDSYSVDQQAVLTQTLGGYLQRMGYDV
ncbi:MAG TPA: sulfotransferase domain-containing protein [Anaerolineales bacterium]|nr:sulfotransferase domain-containing protein [Anaerolineales bacterium]